MATKKPKQPKAVNASNGMNPHKERRELGQKSPKPNIAMAPMRKSSGRGR